MTGSPGYALSCYLSPPGALALTAPRHDQSVALWRYNESSVELVRVWELERLSGQKHHYWPIFSQEVVTRFLEDLLADEGLTLDHVSEIWGTPGLPKSVDIALPDGAQQFPIHSLAHLYSGLLIDSSIYSSETIVGLALDGGPDYGVDQHSKDVWYAGCVSREGRVNFYPVESPGALYEAAHSCLEWEPGTLMALASACDTSIDFNVEVEIESVTFYGGRTPPLTAGLRFVESVLRTARSQLGDADLGGGFTADEHVGAAVMKVVQAACELVTVRNVRRLIEVSGTNASDAYLSLSGGFALNCPTNSLVLEKFGFRGLLIPPCANDSGQALGLGLLGLLGTGRLDSATFELGSAYYGRELGDVDAALSEFAAYVKSVGAYSKAQFINDLCASPIVWADGASEIGPRALGHRSILADPRSARSRDLLNEYKGRQWWRPVAPIVLAERVGEWFENDRPSPFMLETSLVKERKRGRVPAIVHCDGSARHQTLERHVNPFLYDAIAAFGDETGVPLVCNTSLNDKGEPIADLAGEALNFAVRKGIAVAYIGGRRVELRSASNTTTGLSGPHPRSVAAFTGDMTERDEAWLYWRNLGYSDVGIFLLSRFPELKDTRLATAARVNQLAEFAMGRDDTDGLSLAAAAHLRTLGPGAQFSPGSRGGIVGG